MYIELPQKYSDTCSKSNYLRKISKILFSVISAGVFCSYLGVLVYIRHKERQFSETSAKCLSRYNCHKPMLLLLFFMTRPHKGNT